MKKKKINELNKYARFTGIAFEMLVIIGGLTWLGVWLDTKTSCEIPWFTIFLAPFSVIAALILVISALNRMNK